MFDTIFPQYFVRFTRPVLRYQNAPAYPFRVGTNLSCSVSTKHYFVPVRGQNVHVLTDRGRLESFAKSAEQCALSHRWRVPYDFLVETSRTNVGRRPRSGYVRSNTENRSREFFRRRYGWPADLPRATGAFVKVRRNVTMITKLSRQRRPKSTIFVATLERVTRLRIRSG